MRRFVAFVLLGLAGLAPVAPAAETSLAFQYTIERADSESDATFLRGFETKEGLRLRVKLAQESFCYVLLSGKDGTYQLVFPNADTLRMALPVGEWARIPKSTFVRMGDDPKSEKMYIIVAAQRVTELDEAAQKGQIFLTTAKAQAIRDRYGKGTYTRGQDGRTVSLRYRPNPGDSASIVEDVSVQAAVQGLEPAKRPDSK